MASRDSNQIGAQHREQGPQGPPETIPQFLARMEKNRQARAEFRARSSAPPQNVPGPQAPSLGSGTGLAVPSSEAQVSVPGVTSAPASQIEQTSVSGVASSTAGQEVQVSVPELGSKAVFSPNHCDKHSGASANRANEVTEEARLASMRSFFQQGHAKKEAETALEKGKRLAKEALQRRNEEM